MSDENEKRPRGRPSKLTPEVLETIITRLASGCTVEVAAQSVGVARGTVHVWLSRGQEFLDTAEAAGEDTSAPEDLYAQLVIGIDQAKAESQIGALAAIRAAAANGVWQAAAWFLERTYPDEFATQRARGTGGRPQGSSSSPDRPSTGDEPPPRVRLRRVQ